MDGAKKFRKKPVVIEAIKFDDLDSYMAICQWARSRGIKSDGDDGLPSTPSLEELFRYETPIMLVRTLEGTMAANPGDWVIQGIAGEFYPCKPGIFEATYEAVPDAH
jgi:hypothetical protein